MSYGEQVARNLLKGASKKKTSMTEYIYLLIKNFSFFLKKCGNSRQKVLCKKRCYEKFHKTHRQTPVPKSLF